MVPVSISEGRKNHKLLNNWYYVGSGGPKVPQTVSNLALRNEESESFGPWVTKKDTIIFL